LKDSEIDKKRFILNQSAGGELFDNDASVKFDGLEESRAEL